MCFYEEYGSRQHMAEHTLSVQRSSAQKTGCRKGARTRKRGGLSKVCRLTGMSHHMVIKGIGEVRNGRMEPITRLRREGGRRKKIVEKVPEIETKIRNILEENTAGDPMSYLKWTNKSVRNIAGEVSDSRHHMGKDTVASVVRGLGFSLQSNRKSLEGERRRRGTDSSDTSTGCSKNI